MSTARMKRRAKKKVRQQYGIQPCREITFRDGTVLLTYTVDLKPKPYCKKRTRRRPTWGWRSSPAWQDSQAVAQAKRVLDAMAEVVGTQDILREVVIDTARWTEYQQRMREQIAAVPQMYWPVRDIRGSISPLIPGVHTAEQAAEVLGIYSRLREAGYDRLEPLSDANPLSALLRQARKEPEPRESVFEEARRKIMPEINARLREDMDRQAFFGIPPDSH